jgi:hypothetical protein
MLKILIVRSIFCPDLKHLRICASNLVNLFTKLRFQKPDNHKYAYTLYLCGWAKKQYINDLKQAVDLSREDNIFKDIIFDLWALNYGKYKILNAVIDKCESYDKFFYSDHDIIFKHRTSTLFTILDNVLNYEVKNYKVGIVMLNQLEDVRHQCDIYENVISCDGVSYIFPNFGNLTSIASGCFYADCKVFKSLSTFSVDTVYGLDDYHIIKKLYDKLLIAVVVKDYFVVHPFDDDEKYSEWKIDNVKKAINKLYGSDKNGNNYYLEIEKSMNLWT